MWMIKLLIFCVLAHADGDEAVDLGAMGLDEFTPYVVERNPYWMLLPALAIVMVGLHLRKIRKKEKYRKG